jgi:peptidase C39-like protein
VAGGERLRKLRLVRWVIALAVVVLGVTLWLYAVPGKIASSGGLFFISRLVLPVQRFAQSDPRWADDPLGPTDSSMGAEGCAVTSAAMVLSYYGIDTDPARLNEYLTDHDGYTPQGWLFWEKAADFSPGVVRHAYEDLPSYYLIDTNLMRGNPVIVRIHLANGVTHFVVIAGKEGFDYLIQDPATHGAAGIYPLRSLAEKIEALRFYERL